MAKRVAKKVPAKRVRKPPPAAAVALAKARGRRDVVDDLDDVAEVGNDEHEGEAVAVVRGAGGALAFLPMPPAGLERLSGEGIADVAALQQAVMARRELLHQVDVLVESLRLRGASWGVIGWSVGTSAEAARQRWS